MNDLYKKAFFILIIFLFIIFLPIEARANVNKVIKVAGDEYYPPYEFVDNDGVYRGFNVDIMRAIAIDLEKDIEIVPMTWQRALEALDKGKVDVIQGITRSVIREKKYNFTDALVVNYQAIFVRNDINNVSELSDLAGLTVAIQSGDISEEFIKRVPRVSIIIKINQEQEMKALLDGKVDAFVGNRLTGLYILQNLKQLNRVKIVGGPLYPTKYCSATLKANKDMINLLNKGIDDIKKNGTYDKIYLKWFGETFYDGATFWKRSLIAICMALIIVIAIVVFIFYWNRSLKRLVAFKTGELASANDELHAEQERLKQSNRLNGKVLENIIDGIIAFNKDGKVLVANLAAKELLQIDIEPGLLFEEFRFNSDSIYLGYGQALQGNVWRKNLEWEKGSGEILYIDCIISPIKGSEDVVEGVILVLHDYTKSKLLNEAKEYDKLKTEFFANLSHELRTPLSVISASIQLLELHEKSNNEIILKNTIDKTAFVIRQNINRLTRLINNIIDITKADTGFLELQLNNYNIVSIIEEVTMSVVDYFENKGISIQFDTDIEEKIVACDAEKIERILLNLLSNSVKFTKAGGSIIVKVMDGEKFITISVKDTGIGIPKDKQALIFERFRQVDQSISRSNEGSGIGLSIVKSLVELHGGTIMVVSTYGFGSEFIIQLPAIVLSGNLTEYKIENSNSGITEIEFSDINL